MYYKYGYKNFLLPKQNLEDENYFLNLVNEKFKSNELFINNVEQFSFENNIDNIFFKIPTVTLLYPWKMGSIIPENLKTDFEYNFFIVPYNILTGGNKLLKNVNLNILSARDFVKKETL